MNLKNWKPKNDLVGVPGKGFIRAKDFSQEDLDNLVARAKNRNKDVHSFLLGADLVPVNAQTELELEAPLYHRNISMSSDRLPKAAPEWVEAPLELVDAWGEEDKSSQFEPKKEDTKPKRKKRTK